MGVKIIEVPPEQPPSGPALRIIVTARGVERVETVGGSLANQFEALRLGQVILPVLGFVNAAVGRYRPLRPREPRKRATASKGAAGEG